MASSASLVGVPELNNADPERQAATNLSLIISNAVSRRVARSLRPLPPKKRS